MTANLINQLVEEYIYSVEKPDSHCILPYKRKNKVTTDFYEEIIDVLVLVNYIYKIYFILANYPSK